MSNAYVSTALRQLVYKRADNCCEYCLVPESHSFASHEIDHVIAEKHGGLTIAENLALSCALCNKHKGSDLTSIDPETGLITPLYNPRTDVWSEHFQISKARFVPLTPIGRVTVRLLQLNRQERIDERDLLIKANVLKIS